VCVLRNLICCSLQGTFIRCVPLRILFHSPLTPRNNRSKFRTMRPSVLFRNTLCTSFGMTVEHVPSLSTIGQFNNFKRSCQKCTSIKIYVCIYNLLIIRNVAIFLDYSPRVLHQTGIYKMQMNYPVDYNFIPWTLWIL